MLFSDLVTMVDHLSTNLTLGWFVALSIVTTLTLVSYRLSFHPLAAFPGPKLAALNTGWLYYISKKTFPEHVLKRLHGQYSQLTWLKLYGIIKADSSVQF